jgi:hypothetical protein
VKIWVDDIRPAPEGYVWCKSVNETKNTITTANAKFANACRKGLKPDPSLHIELIDLDHDSGDYASDGGDYIQILNWLEWLYEGKDTYTKFRLHSMNPVGVENMRRIIQRNGWTEVR